MITISLGLLSIILVELHIIGHYVVLIASRFKPLGLNTFKVLTANHLLSLNSTGAVSL